jgi:hypothetical protein
VGRSAEQGYRQSREAIVAHIALAVFGREAIKIAER